MKIGDRVKVRNFADRRIWNTILKNQTACGCFYMLDGWIMDRDHFERYHKRGRNYIDRNRLYILESIEPKSSEKEKVVA